MPTKTAPQSPAAAVPTVKLGARHGFAALEVVRLEPDGTVRTRLVPR